MVAELVADGQLREVALWKSLLVTAGEVMVFLDADMTRWGSHFVTGLLGPLLDRAQQTLLVKACYDRVGDGPIYGSRVTGLGQFVREDAVLRPKPRPVSTAERPPVRSLRRSAAG